MTLVNWFIRPLCPKCRRLVWSNPFSKMAPCAQKPSVVSILLGFVDQNSLRAINSEVFPGLSASLQTNGLEFAYYNNALWGDSYLVQRNDRVDFDLSLEELNRQCIVNEDSCHVFFVNETQNWVGVCVDSEGLISTPEEPLTQTDCQF